MKIGISSYSFASYMKKTGANYIDICDKAKEIGYDAIEFIPFTNGEGTTLEWSLDMADKIRARCDEIGLEITAYTVGADVVKEEADETVKYLFDCLQITKRLGAKVMRHDVCFKLPCGMTWEDAMHEAVPRIRRVADRAAEMGITTCIENHGRIFQDPERVEALVLATDRKNFGWLCDMGNFLCTDCDPLESVKIASKYAVHVHAKDFLYKRCDDVATAGFGIGTSGGNFIRGTVVGHGVVPIGECINVLRAAGYNGNVSLEFEGAEEPEYALENGYKNLKAYVEASE